VIRNGHAGFGRAASEKDPQGHLADVVPRPANDQQSAPSSPTARPASRPRRSQSPGQHNAGCTAPGPGSSNAPSAARSSPSPRPANSPDSAGRSAKSNSTRPTTLLSVGWVGGGPARAGNPRLRYEQPAREGRPRPILDSGNPTTNHGPAATRIRVYQPDRASRTARRAATNPADHIPSPSVTNQRKQEIRDVPIDKRLSISAQEAQLSRPLRRPGR